MAQLFHPSTNTLAKVSILGAVLIAGALGAVVTEISSSPYVTRAQDAREQPVPFSHKHHVSGLGIDCRYCHTSVEKSSFAGIPATEICMSCHSQIWVDSPMLEPVRESMRTNVPIAWNRVHDLPDYAYFNHSAHVRRGIGCVSCHGRVDTMEVVYQAEPLSMGWCLECHRNPERHLRPLDTVTDMDWVPEEDQEVLGARLAEMYDINPPVDCNTCHR